MAKTNVNYFRLWWLTRNRSCGRSRLSRNREAKQPSFSTFTCESVWKLWATVECRADQQGRVCVGGARVFIIAYRAERRTRTAPDAFPAKL